MALSLKTIFLVLGHLILCSFQPSSASRGRENEKCGEKRFYCPTNGKCFDRELRCNSATVCLDSNGKEAKCYESSTAGMYEYYRKESPITSGSSSRKKRSVSNLKHWFVEYRGFVYEFGKAGFQQLDINDPNYKYGPGREKVLKEELKGTSRCTTKQVRGFSENWEKANPKYHLIANNCQDFVKALLQELESNCPSRVRRQDEDKESLKAQCSINSAGLSSVFSFNWKLYAFLTSLIAFAIFDMI